MRKYSSNKILSRNISRSLFRRLFELPRYAERNYALNRADRRSGQTEIESPQFGRTEKAESNVFLRPARSVASFLHKLVINTSNNNLQLLIIADNDPRGIASSNNNPQNLHTLRYFTFLSDYNY